jgi:hypothetical protein
MASENHPPPVPESDAVPCQNCGHDVGWHFRNEGSCLECACLGTAAGAGNAVDLMATRCTHGRPEYSCEPCFNQELLRLLAELSGRQST